MKSTLSSKTYGLVGYPLGHSFSKEYFTTFFQQEGIRAEYKNFELPAINGLPQILEEETTLQGFNVTIPYKQQVIPYLNELDAAAEAIGAVNVVKVTHCAEHIYLKGYNTDVIGFTDSIRPLLKPHHTHALILGTGGASKAVNYALRQLGLETCFVSRSRRERMLTYEELVPEVFTKYMVIVNTTPLGTFPNTNEFPPIDYTLINDRFLLFDLVYNPVKTLFLQRGEQAGATIRNGLEMLIGQAKAAWRIWNER